jgi:aminodeoxyfutalosine deaminase
MVDLEALRRIPKLEFHCHLEGSLTPELAFELAQKNGVDLGVSSPQELRARYDFPTFHDFLMLFGDLTFVLAEPDDFRTAVLGYARQASTDGVIYAELTLTLGTHVHFKGLDPIKILEAVADGAAEAMDRHGIMIRFILDHVRSFPEDQCAESVEWCKLGAPLGVVGLGLGGPEAGWLASRFDTQIRQALDAGISFVPHAGEAAGPESIWDALKYSPRRIGHGLSAIQDAELIDTLANSRVMIELCIGSEQHGAATCAKLRRTSGARLS